MRKAATIKEIETDVIIVGGGAAGCTMAALLAANGVGVVCLDAEDPARTITANFDGRTMAVSYGSKIVIGAAGAWDEISKHACAIQDIQIMEEGGKTLLDFSAKEIEKPAFGWITEYRHLRKALYQRLQTLSNAQHITPVRVTDFEVNEDCAVAFLADGRCVRGRIIIGADGKNSFTREWAGIDTRGKDYQQRAVVCVVQHEFPHNNIAIEDFRREGPFAILPMNDDESGKHQSSIVWTEHSAGKDGAQKWDDATFNAALNERFPAQYGKVHVAGPRFGYDLMLKHAHRYTAPRMALIADAAHAIHPIAGQGLNLGLRDVAALAQIIIAAKKNGDDLGGSAMLETYEKERRADNMTMAGATDTLNHIFSNNIVPMRFARTTGLRLIEKIPRAKKFFMKQAMGVSGLLPDLIRHGKF